MPFEEFDNKTNLNEFQNLLDDMNRWRKHIELKIEHIGDKVDRIAKKVFQQEKIKITEEKIEENEAGKGS